MFRLHPQYTMTPQGCQGVGHPPQPEFGSPGAKRRYPSPQKRIRHRRLPQHGGLPAPFRQVTPPAQGLQREVPRPPQLVPHDPGRITRCACREHQTFYIVQRREMPLSDEPIPHPERLVWPEGDDQCGIVRDHSRRAKQC